MTIASIFSTPEDIALTVLRVTLAVVILPHGLQKLAGAFGGYGFKGTMGYLAQLDCPLWLHFWSFSSNRLERPECSSVLAQGSQLSVSLR